MGQGRRRPLDVVKAGAGFQMAERERESKLRTHHHVA